MTKKDKFISSLLYPVYSLYNTSWQVYFLKESIWKGILQKLLLWLAPRHNYVIRLLNNDKTVKKSDVESYVPMTGGRWTSHLGKERCNRHHYPLSYFGSELGAANTLDRDLLIKLWNLRNPNNCITNTIMQK